jgi:hypothetical protein
VSTTLPHVPPVGPCDVFAQSEEFRELFGELWRPC